MTTRGKSVSFNAMVKFFLKSYHIPTKKDVDRLHDRLDMLEQLMRASFKSLPVERRSPERAGDTVGGGQVSASRQVLNIIQAASDGIRFSDVQLQTGFPEKKLRNIIFRLSKNGRISRKSRGLYVIPQ